MSSFSKKSERIGLFIDGANFFATTKQLSFVPDYKLLLDYFQQQKGDLKKAAYYTGIVEDTAPNPLVPMLDYLEYNGWDVVTKPAKVWINSATGERKIKGNLDLELAVDVIDSITYLDRVYLFSGDGDFTALVKWVQRHGVKVTVVSTIKTNPPMCADELRRQASDFLDVHELCQFVSRQRKTRA